MQLQGYQHILKTSSKSKPTSDSCCLINSR